MATKYINSITYGGNEYKIIDDTSGYTKNTGTVTSVGLTNATNGGLTVSGSPVTGSGSITVGHTNVLTNAQTTQAVYPIAIDKNGHISSYGTAVNIPTPELFVVNATITQMSGGVPTGGTTDKSAEEIYNAAAAGLLPIVKVTMPGVGTVYLVAPLALTENPGDSYYARFVYEDQDNATFQYATLQVVGNNFAIAFLPPYLKSGGFGDGGASLQISADDVSLMFNDGDSNVWDVSNSTTPATIGHITSVTSANTQAVYPITIDGNGHITGYGNAVTPLEPFKITLTVQPGPTYVPDKTYAEVTAAEAAGKFVYVYFHDTDAQTDMTYILPLVSINNDSGEIYFECFGNGCYYVCTINSQNGADFETLSMGSSGGGTVTSVSISGTSPITASGTVTSSGTLSVSHAASGVTAGTYVATDYDSSKLGSYDSIEFPTITVDSTGHITSASAYGKVLGKAINSSMASNQTGLMSYAEAYNLSYNLDFLFPHIYTDSAGLGFTIAAGSSSKTVNMAVGYNQIASTSTATSSQKLLSPILYSYRIVGIDAVLYNSTTKYEPVIVDWSATDISYNSTGWTCTVTVSTGEAVPTGYTLYFKILYSPYVSM